MTPFELEILMHHHITPSPFPRETALYEQIVSDFISIDILDSNKSTTIRGKAWIYCILNTPFPKTKTVFIDDRGNIIGSEE